MLLAASVLRSTFSSRVSRWCPHSNAQRSLVPSVTVCASAMPSFSTNISVAVIGAGAAGLVAARELHREGLQVTVFEQGKQLGGVWLFEPEIEDDPLGVDPNRRRVFSSMYAGLRTNLPREVMSYSDFPMTPAAMRGLSIDGRTFCGHEEVQRYLLAFAATFDLEPLIQLGTRVVSALPLLPQGSTASANNSSADHVDAPSNGLPMSDSAADCSSRAQSSHDSAMPIHDGLNGRGNSNSSSGGGSNDSAVPCHDGNSNESSGEGSTSSGGSSLLNGAPSSKIPSSWRQWQLTTSPMDGKGAESVHTFDALVVCNGHFSEPRLPPAPGTKHFKGRQMHSHNYREAGPFTGQRVVIVGAAASGEDIGREIALCADQVFLSSKQWDPESALAGERRNIQRMPTFLGFDEDSPATVLFDCGQEAADIDTVVYSTGYVYSFPFLEDAGAVTVANNRVSPLYQHVWPPALAPSLSFIGIPWKVVPFPQYELQAKWVARVLAGRAMLPGQDAMQEHVEASYGKLEAQGLEQRFTHRLNGNLQWEYNNWLAQQCGNDVEPSPLWRMQLYEEAGTNRKAHIASYRDIPLNKGCLQAAHQHADSHAVSRR